MPGILLSALYMLVKLSSTTLKEITIKSFVLHMGNCYTEKYKKPTKVHTIKAIIFPVLMYRCENWTIKKAETEELMVLNCGAGEDS